MPDNVIPLIPAGKIRCFVSGSLRKDTKEENVRQRWARSLVEEYGYLKSDIAVEFPIKMGSSRKRADIVVFKDGAPRKQENIYIIVEAKTDDTLPAAAGDGLAQLKSYMSASIGCRYGLWVGSEKIVVEKVDGSLEDGVGDIPSKGDSEPQPPVFSELAPAVELNAVFRRCHNYIYVNQGLQKAEAFHEFLKLIFCKVYDETESTGELQFYVRAEERRSEAGQRRVQAERIEPLFENVKERYPYIFESGEQVKLKRRVLAYIVSELQRISLLRTKADVKGSAYEELVGSNLRGDRGEYFTPRNVCDMAVRMALEAHPRQRLGSLKVIDVCCGTGGFLVSYLNALRELFTEFESSKRGGNVSAVVSERIKDVCSRNMFGLDINPFLVRTCQMNLVMHGDGSSNVFPADSLLSPGEWDSEDAANHVPYGKADIVLTNPPFGSKAMIDDPHVLSKFELPSYQAANQRAAMPVEQLFVEAALKFLKPGGVIAIVLPDGILNNPGLEFIRRWFVRRAQLMATIDLPKETFATSGGVPNPSVVLARKFTRDQIKLAESGALDPYDVFMATPETAGINKRGNPVFVRLPNGMEILDDNMQPVIDDEIALVAGRFGEWVRHGGIG